MSFRKFLLWWSLGLLTIGVLWILAYVPTAFHVDWDSPQWDLFFSILFGLYQNVISTAFYWLLGLGLFVIVLRVVRVSLKRLEVHIEFENRWQD